MVAESLLVRAIRPEMVREKLRNGRTFIRNISRGMIFWAEVGPGEARGSEQNHKVPSPWLVVSTERIHQRLPIVQAVPLTSKIEKGAGEFRVFRIKLLESEIQYFDIPNPGAAPDRPLNPGEQLALTEQMRVLAHERLLGDPVAQVTSRGIFSVEAGIRYVSLGSPSPPPARS